MVRWALPGEPAKLFLSSYFKLEGKSIVLNVVKNIWTRNFAQVSMLGTVATEKWGEMWDPCVC